MSSYNIPKQLQNPAFRFVLIRPNSKRPFEEKWQEENNYAYDHEKLQKHLVVGGNYGLVCGYGNLVVIDCDQIVVAEAVEKFLPETFKVKTGRGGTHYYYICKDFDRPIRLTSGNALGDIGDVQWKGKQVIAPGSTHENGNKYQALNNKKIAEVKAEQIIAAIHLWIAKETGNEVEKITQDDKISIEDVINISRLKKHGSEYYGKHPIHGSDSGTNFWVNPHKGTWHCFRHGTGGGALSWIAVKEGIINCDQAVKGILRGEKFKQTLKKAKEQYGYKDDQLKNLGLAIKKATNWLVFAQEFLTQNPMYYDNNGLWWNWNKENYAWEIIDETDIMNMVDETLEDSPETATTSIKTQILESLKRKARLKKPKTPKTTWIQFKDKIVNINDGTITTSSPDYFFTNPIPWTMAEKIETPTIDRLFTEWVGEEKKELLYEIVAFSLSTKYFMHNLFCLTGGGANGKSSFLGLLRTFLGSTNVCSTDLDLLCESRFESSKLFKKLVCIMGETNFSTLKRTSLLKRLTGEDLINFEFKNKKPFDEINYAKIIIATNSLPQTEDKTKGFYRRWLIVDFPNEFDCKTDILETIPKQEYEAIATKSALLLKQILKKRCFVNEGTIEERAQAYEEKSNPLLSFIKENCIQHENNDVPFFVFYEEYSDYLEKRRYRKASRRSVGTALKNEGFESERRHITKKNGSDTTWHYILGLRLKSSENITDY